MEWTVWSQGCNSDRRILGGLVAAPTPFSKSFCHGEKGNAGEHFSYIILGPKLRTPRPPPPLPRDASEGKGPQRRPRRRLDRRLEAVAKAVRGRLLSVTNASQAGTCRQGDSGWA